MLRLRHLVVFGRSARVQKTIAGNAELLFFEIESPRRNQFGGGGVGIQGLQPCPLQMRRSLDRHCAFREVPPLILQTVVLTLLVGDARPFEAGAGHCRPRRWYECGVSDVQ